MGEEWRTKAEIEGVGDLIEHVREKSEEREEEKDNGNENHKKTRTPDIRDERKRTTNACMHACTHTIYNN